MIEHREPKVLELTEAFKWWFSDAKSKKPHLKLTHAHNLRNNNLPKGKEIEVISINKDELTYLRKKVSELDLEATELEKSDLHKWYFTETTFKIAAIKKEVYNIEDRIKVLEKSNPNGRKVLMNLRVFKEIIIRYNKKVLKALVEEGEAIKLGNNLGYLYLYTKEKTDMFSPANINWGASNKYKQELIDKGEQIKDKDHPDGKNWWQFFEDSEYIRVAWTKNFGTCRVPNNSVYAFYPTRSEAGINKALSAANRKDPYLKEKYIDVTRRKSV